MNDNDKLITILEKMFKLEPSGHDLNHLVRTTNIALHLQKNEGGDREVIYLASMLHDVHRIMQNEQGVFVAPVDSLPKVEEILGKIDYNKNKKGAILHAIEHHEEYTFSDGVKTNEIEALILQDADNLDGMGAVGIARAFSYGGANNCPIYDPNTPLKAEKFTDAVTDPSEIHHFYNKLLRLKDNMNTKTAKIMAEDRHKFMEKYLDEFFSEWNGDK